MKKELNDEQDNAIIEAATHEFDVLNTLYNEFDKIKTNYLNELMSNEETVNKQELKVIALCSGRIKLIKDPKTKQLIMDLTEE